MQVTFIPAKKEQVGIIPPNWIYPPDFMSLAGQPLSMHAANRHETDYERDGNGVARRRYEGQNAIDSSGIQGDYQEQFLEYQGIVTGVIPSVVLAAANEVYSRWEMGDVILHRSSNPGVGLIASWTHSPIRLKTIGELAPDFVAWAHVERPDLLVEPWTSIDPKDAILYPQSAVVGYQTASIQSGRAIRADLLHPGLAPQLQKQNVKLLKAESERLEVLLDAALASLMT